MRIMIVEDQQIILMGLKKMIEDELSCRIDTLSGGEAALQRLMSSPAPDVVISDIVMPGMDGLLFIEQARRLLPFCRFFIISGYDRFAFAQKALQLGVMDYFLKPIERRRLLDTLQTVSRQQDEEWKKRRAACLEDFYQSQITARSAEPYIDSVQPGTGLKAGAYCVRGEDRQLDRHLPGCYLMGEDGETRLYLLLLPEEQFDARHRELLSMTGRIAYGVEEQGNAALALRRCALADDNRFFAAGEEREFSCEDELKRLDAALALTEGGEEAVNMAVSALFRAFENAQGSARDVRAAVAVMLERLLGHGNDFQLEREWQTAGDYGSFLDKVRGHLANHLGQGREDTVVYKIRRYVDAHCAQPLDVKKVAQAVALSPNYASSLFKKETGESLSAYIRQRQLEVARHMLLFTDMRVYEIAEQLGYSDEKHFSTLFRKHYNCSPNVVRRERETTNPQEIVQAKDG